MTREVGSDVQLVAACRYIALNPVEAGLVADPLDWPWSSARAHAGLERSRIPLAERDPRAAFGNDNDWRKSYRTQIDSTHNEEEASKPMP